MIERIKQIIISEGLHLPNRHREIVYRRFYLCYLLRKNKLTLREIGEIFGKTHATIIHSINSHYHWYNKKDSSYLSSTLDLRDMFPVKTSLKHEISKVKTLEELEVLKDKIRKNIY